MSRSNSVRRPRDIAEDDLEFPLLSQDSYPVKTRSVTVFVGKQVTGVVRNV